MSGLHAVTRKFKEVCEFYEDLNHYWVVLPEKIRPPSVQALQVMDNLITPLKDLEVRRKSKWWQRFDKNVSLSSTQCRKYEVEFTIIKVPSLNIIVQIYLNSIKARESSGSIFAKDYGGSGLIYSGKTLDDVGYIDGLAYLRGPFRGTIP